MAVRKRSPLGGNYWRLWVANAVSVTGDGVTTTGGPLLAASITHNPLLVAGALFAQQLPWLIFALLSGVLVDRLEPGRLMVIADLLRAAALGSLTGGLLAHGFGLAAPFWVAAVAVAIVAMLAWRLFTPGHLTAEPAASTSRQS